LVALLLFTNALNNTLKINGLELFFGTGTMVLAISPFSCFSDFLDLILARVLQFPAFLLEKTNNRT
jgi:hypothetical protein